MVAVITLLLFEFDAAKGEVGALLVEVLRKAAAIEEVPGTAEGDGGGGGGCAVSLPLLNLPGVACCESGEETRAILVVPLLLLLFSFA